MSNLLNESFSRLKAHESTERDGDSKVEDSTLVGLIILVKELLVCYSKQTEYKDLVELTKKNGFLHEFYYEMLYFIPDRTTRTQNKCKAKRSRIEAYKLLYQLTNTFKPKEMAEFLEDYLWPMIKDLSRPTPWRYQPSEK